MLLPIFWNLLFPRDSMPFLGLTKISLEDALRLDPLQILDFLERLGLDDWD